jgi:glycine/D-amino acid oxidase-like deaminating enzyme
MSSLVNKKICILGAGVVGLSTAYRLIELFPNKGLDITLIAKDFGKETTSDGAGGLFRPDDRFMPGVEKKIATYYH